MPEILAKLSSGKSVILSAEDIGGGVYALKTTANLSGDINITDVNVGIAEEDGVKAVLYSDEDVADISVDSHGRIWIAGYNIFDKIMNAPDRHIKQTENGSGQITRIDADSPTIDAELGSTIVARTDYTYYASGNVDEITRSLVIT